jgi:hypothetical protein
LGVVVRPHGNGLVFEDVVRGVRVKASAVGRELGKARLCQRLGAFEPASERQLVAAREALHRYSPVPARAPQSLWKEYEQTLQENRARRQRDWARYRDTAATERRRLKSKYRQQRHLFAALPVSGPDRKRLFQQLVHRSRLSTEGANACEEFSGEIPAGRDITLKVQARSTTGELSPMYNLVVAPAVETILGCE